MSTAVIITCFNRENSIRRAIFSVMWQTVPVDKIIVVDDGSDDNSVDEIKKISSEKILLIRHDDNLGQNAAINSALNHVKDLDFISFLDSDDIWLPNFHEEMLKSISDEVGFVYCWTVNGRKSTLNIENNFEDVLQQGFLSSMITILIRSNCFQNVNFFPSEISNSQDDYFCFLASKFYKFDLVPQELALIIGDDISYSKNRKRAAVGWKNLFQFFEADIRDHLGVSGVIKYQIMIAAKFARSKNIKLSFHHFMSGTTQVRSAKNFLQALKFATLLCTGAVKIFMQYILAFLPTSLLRRIMKV